MNRFFGRRRRTEVAEREALTARLADLESTLAVVAEKVGELHGLSIEGHLPERILKP